MEDMEVVAEYHNIEVNAVIAKLGMLYGAPFACEDVTRAIIGVIGVPALLVNWQPLRNAWKKTVPPFVPSHLKALVADDKLFYKTAAAYAVERPGTFARLVDSYPLAFHKHALACIETAKSVVKASVKAEQIKPVQVPVQETRVLEKGEDSEAITVLKVAQQAATLDMQSQVDLLAQILVGIQKAEGEDAAFRIWESLPGCCYHKAAQEAFIANAVDPDVAPQLPFANWIRTLRSTQPNKFEACTCTLKPSVDIEMQTSEVMLNEMPFADLSVRDLADQFVADMGQGIQSSSSSPKSGKALVIVEAPRNEDSYITQHHGKTGALAESAIAFKEEKKQEAVFIKEKELLKNSVASVVASQPSSTPSKKSVEERKEEKKNPFEKEALNSVSAKKKSGSIPSEYEEVSELSADFEYEHSGVAPPVSVASVPVKQEPAPEEEKEKPFRGFVVDNDSDPNVRQFLSIETRAMSCDQGDESDIIVGGRHHPINVYCFMKPECLVNSTSLATLSFGINDVESKLSTVEKRKMNAVIIPWGSGFFSPGTSTYKVMTPPTVWGYIRKHCPAKVPIGMCYQPIRGHWAFIGYDPVTHILYHGDSLSPQAKQIGDEVVCEFLRCIVVPYIRDIYLNNTMKKMQEYTKDTSVELEQELTNAQKCTVKCINIGTQYDKSSCGIYAIEAAKRFSRTGYLTPFIFPQGDQKWVDNARAQLLEDIHVAQAFEVDLFTPQPTEKTPLEKADEFITSEKKKLNVNDPEYGDKVRAIVNAAESIPGVLPEKKSDSKKSASEALIETDSAAYRRIEQTVADRTDSEDEQEEEEQEEEPESEGYETESPAKKTPGKPKEPESQEYACDPDNFDIAAYAEKYPASHKARIHSAEAIYHAEQEYKRVFSAIVVMYDPKKKVISNSKVTDHVLLSKQPLTDKGHTSRHPFSARKSFDAKLFIADICRFGDGLFETTRRGAGYAKVCVRKPVLDDWKVIMKYVKLYYAYENGEMGEKTNKRQSKEDDKEEAKDKKVTFKEGPKEIKREAVQSTIVRGAGGTTAFSKPATPGKDSLLGKRQQELPAPTIKLSRDGLSGLAPAKELAKLEEMVREDACPVDKPFHPDNRRFSSAKIRADKADDFSETLISLFEAAERFGPSKIPLKMQDLRFILFCKGYYTTVIEFNDLMHAMSHVLPIFEAVDGPTKKFIRTMYEFTRQHVMQEVNELRRLLRGYQDLDEETAQLLERPGSMIKKQ